MFSDNCLVDVYRATTPCSMIYNIAHNVLLQGFVSPSDNGLVKWISINWNQHLM